jgi:CCR4-NOT transcriptional regulation complex NOT5 subunit
VASLAGSTSRVGEVLDSVHEITTVGSAPFKVRLDAPSSSGASSDDAKADGASSPTASALPSKAEQDAFLAQWRQLGDVLRAQRLQNALASSSLSSSASASTSTSSAEVIEVKNGGGAQRVGESIEFRDCAIVSPDGRLLVEHLDVCIPAGTNVMVCHPTQTPTSPRSLIFPLYHSYIPNHIHACSLIS